MRKGAERDAKEDPAGTADGGAGSGTDRLRTARPKELYALPDPSPEYKSLQSSLESLLNMGYEYAAPISGSHTQSVQLEDLDGDGVDEALAFLRDTSGKEHPLKICIFKADGEGGYTQYCTIAGDGDPINSVVYCQLNGTPTKELVVGWRISSTVYVLSAYSIENGNVTELMTASNYTRYAVKDMDQDNQEEIVSILMNSSDDAGGSTATYYDWSEDTMKGINSVSLSANADSLDSVRYHYLTNSYPALDVTSFLRNNGSAAQSTSSVVTDVLGVVNKRLSNLTLDPQSGDSTTVHLALAEPRDINSDNVLELPMSLACAATAMWSIPRGAYVLNWVQYALDGAERFGELHISQHQRRLVPDPAGRLVHRLGRHLYEWFARQPQRYECRRHGGAQHHVLSSGQSG